MGTADRRADRDSFAKDADLKNEWFRPECFACGGPATAGVVSDWDGPVWTFLFYCNDHVGDQRIAIFTREAWAWRQVAHVGPGAYRLVRKDAETTRSEK